MAGHPGVELPPLSERIQRIRAAGGVPLVGDDRWSRSHWDLIQRLAGSAPAPPGTAWATLTSGSTGNPRVVLRSARSWSASFAAVESLLGAREGDVIALPAPPASSLSLFSIAHGLDGGPLPLLPAGHAVTTGGFSEATLFHGTPHGLRLLLDAGAPPRLRAALVGGSALDGALRSRAESLGIRVVSYYGAAELSFVAMDQGAGYVPFPGVDVDIRKGRLWVRSPFAATGYLGGEGGPASRGPFRSADGWHTVGDRAVRVDGRLRFLGRSDGAILTASATVVPEEVESTLRSLPGVGDAVVLGLPNAGIGALLAAVVEPAPGARRMTAAHLRVAAAEALSPAHRPRRWFATGLPRTASGKPARAEIARRIAAGEVRPLG